ncbi:hypothetical protein B0T14DRAFT_517547 [Immersiella caudata]|uniref:Uncharacterized protein n=1 Tax=Immersiella caudata TaxID=314043 RepID=A0AA39WZK3_9PEZI|nr:hypothetical protein B0T14DRAFT_517547 [Immersiella caudata]
MSGLKAQEMSSTEEEQATSCATPAAPPPYSGAVPITPPHQIEPPLITIPKLLPPFAPHRPFPPLMTAYCIYSLSLSTFRQFNICAAANKHDILFTAQLSTGFVPHTPLGSRPGIILHNGPTTKDPVLAAAGAESISSSTTMSFNTRSVVILPPVSAPPEATPNAMVTTMMRASRAQEDKGVVFRLSVVVSAEGHRKEEFEWRKVGGLGAEGKEKGYKMLRLAPPGEEEHEVVGILTWPVGTIEKLTKVFTLELKGGALSGQLGERVVLMMLVTASRLWWMRLKGQTAKGYVAVAEKTHGKQAQGQEW